MKHTTEFMPLRRHPDCGYCEALLAERDRLRGTLETILSSTAGEAIYGFTESEMRSMVRMIRAALAEKG